MPNLNLVNVEKIAAIPGTYSYYSWQNFGGTEDLQVSEGLCTAGWRMWAPSGQRDTLWLQERFD